MDWLVAFLVGDYLLQNDWMARGKKKSSWICTVHVFFFMLPFLFLNLSWVHLILIAIQHWIQDRADLVIWFLKVARKEDMTQPPLAPWSTIVMDNVWHIFFIYIIIRWVPGG